MTCAERLRNAATKQQLRLTSVCLSDQTRLRQASGEMKLVVVLVATITLVTAFDFPEEWQAWKTVSL